MIHRNALILACAASACLLGDGIAQTSVVVPAEAATKEGGGLSAIPFGYDRVRVTQYFGSSLIWGKIPLFKQITELAYRRDGQALNTQVLRHPTTPTWQIRMGNYYASATNPGPTFLPPGNGAVNTLTPVFSQAYSFPDLPGGAGPMAFLIRFPLARPFTYQGGGLAIDHYAYETRNGIFAYYVDAVRKQTDFGMFTRYGTSCPATENRASAIPSNPGGDPFIFLLFGGPKNSAAVAILGSSRTRWGPVTLPLGLAIVGLKGCSLYASMDLLLTVGTFSTGAAHLALQVPNDKAFAGLKLYCQWMPIDNRVNPSVPLTMSNGVDVTLGTSIGKGGGIDASLLYGVGGFARNRYGIVDSGLALVTRFTLK